MRINFDRLSQLAGIPGSDESRQGLNESVDISKSPMEEVEAELDQENEMAGMDSDPMEEMIEIDEVMLVQELRRAKKLMENQKRKTINESRRRNMFEAQLKQVIDEEVQNVMEELNLTSQWIYGDNQPKRSRKGYVTQGTMVPGLGFRRR